MRLLFLGAGGVGGYFGGRLAEHGADVTFLVRPGRAAQMADGLRIDSPKGNAVVAVPTIGDGDVAGPFDVVVLTRKAYGLDGAMASITPHVAEGTVILPLLNGLTHIQTIEQRFPQATVWGGVAQIPAGLSPDGTVLHFADLAGMIVGPRSGQGATIPTASELVDALKGAGIAGKLSDQPEQDLWNKWVYLATLAASTCLMRADVGTILSTDHGARLLTGLLAECVAVAAAEGYPPPDAQMKIYRDQLADRGSKWTASMLRDLQGGGPTEADHILGEMIRLATENGIDTPYLGVAYTHLQVYEAGRDS